MNLTYRELKKQDLRDICHLVENKEIAFLSFPNCPFPLIDKQLNEKLNNRFENTVFLDNHKIIGFSNLYYYNKEKEPYIGNVIVDKQYRGKGIGKKILETMIQKAFKYNKYVKLDVLNENQKAYKLYKFLGFQEFNKGTITDYTNKNREVTFMIKT